MVFHGYAMSELESIRVKVAERGATIYAISQNLTISPDGIDISTQALMFALSSSAQIIERQMISTEPRALCRQGKPKGCGWADRQALAWLKIIKLGYKVRYCT